MNPVLSLVIGWSSWLVAVATPLIVGYPISFGFGLIIGGFGWALVARTIEVRRD